MSSKFSYLMMAASVLFATSCESDEELVSVQQAATSTVSFNLSTPQIASRAYSDGLTATVLQYAVYDETGTILSDLTNTAATINGSTTVDLQLVTGNTYSVVFWAAAPGAPYTVDLAAKTMSVSYDNALSNDEARDAFYAYKTFTVEGVQSERIELKRPFAQINIGTSDYAAATKAGYTPTKSSVKVTGVANTLNLFTGEATGEVNASFAFAEIKKDEVFPVLGNEYLAMNYVLVGADKQLVDVAFSYTDDSKTKNRQVSSVPVQRNYRTNIYGKLLTSDVDINIEIKPEFDGAFDNEGYFIEAGENGEIKAFIKSAKGLAAIADAIANGSITNVDIVLDDDIDLSELAVSSRSAAVNNWNPIGTSEKPFTGIFDGKGYTIKNLALVEQEAKEGKAYIGFFGYAKDATIKNVTFENVYINIPCLDIDHSQGHIGAVAGSLEGTSTIENVTVKGDIQVYATQDANGASRVAVVAGGNSYGNVTMKNVHVIANDGSYLIANNNTGALAGQLQGKSVFENCSSNINVTVNKFFAGGIIGLAASDQLFTNCHTTGNVAVVAGREGKAHDQYRVGGIAGGWADGAKNVCTLVDCSYAGEVSGKNSDGSVAEVLDYMGYVGRGYTLNGCQGSKVVINGTVFVQKSNSASEAGDYTIYNINDSEQSEYEFVANGVAIQNGAYYFFNTEGLKWFANEVNTNKNAFSGKTVKLAADINLAGIDWEPIGQTGSTTFNGVFDGQNHTISNLTVNSESETGAHYSSGLFGWVESHTAGHGHIKNVKIAGATITGHHNCGALVGYITQETALVENCHITGAKVNCTKANDDADGDKAGALIGNATVATPVKDCTAANSIVSAGRDAGQLIGAGKEANVTGCSATGVTVEANGTGTGNNVRNELIGRLL